VHPLERLINLTALLLNAARPMTFEEIRERIEAYQHGDAPSAKRMFERDKDVLRDAGVPVDLAATDVWEVEKGYRIDPSKYYLPDLAFTQDETWALFVAAHAPGEDPEAERAFQKLSVGADPNLLTAMADRSPAPGIDASGPNLGAIADALARRRSIRFRYRPLQGRAGWRRVDPYALLFRRGTWYLVGLDVERKDVRSYRLSRMRSEVQERGDASAPPEGFEAASHLDAPRGAAEPTERARVAFSAKVAWWAVASTPGAVRIGVRPDGRVEVEVPAATSEVFASWVLSFGPDARVLGPKGLRDEVVARLEALAGDGEHATASG
jgi:proteasome accessory factor B